MNEKIDLIISESAKIRILIVEDDELVRALLDVIMTDLGHTIVASVDNAVDALVAYSVHRPHVVISDIGIKGSIDGIELAKKLLQVRKCQLLFLTGNTNAETFNRAKKLAPLAFISKPIVRVELERSIDLAVEHSNETIGFITESMPVEGCLYTRIGNKLKKIAIADIEYIEVDGKYSSISVAQRTVNCKISLKELQAKLPQKDFLQVNRSSVINLNCIEDIDMARQMIKMPSAEISIGRNFKESLLNRLNLI
jgi:DNA-binding LytR/AlgR family response regulator